MKHAIMRLLARCSGPRRVSLAAALAVAGIAATGAPSLAATRFGVGVRTISEPAAPYMPAQAIELWYPTAAEADDALVYGTYFAGHAQRDAPLHPGGPFPLLVLSHGMGGSRFDLSWLAEALARAGYVSAAVDHFLSDEGSYDEAESPKLWRRAADLSHLVDTLLAGAWGTTLDARRIAAAGFSLGGSTVLMLAGMQLETERYRQCFPGCGAGVGDSVQDGRVRAVVSLAPGTSCIFAPHGIAKVATPAFLVSGGADEMAPEESNAQYYAEHIAAATYARVADADHFSFTPSCTLTSRLTRFKRCSKPLGVDRDAVHALAAGWSVTFLQQVLR